MQVKYIACYEATRQEIWLKNFIPRLKVSTTYQDQLLCDEINVQESEKRKQSVFLSLRVFGRLSGA
jgi:hypothetical protein